MYDEDRGEGLGDRESFDLETPESVGVRFRSKHVSDPVSPSSLIARDQSLMRVGCRNTCGW